MAWLSDDISAYISSYSNGIAHTNRAVFLYRQNSLTITKNGNVDIKLKAIELGKQWLANFIQTTEPSNVEDEILKDLIIRNMDRWFEKKIMLTLMQDFRTNFFKMAIRWFLKKKEYKISSKMLVYSMFLTLKDKHR